MTAGAMFEFVEGPAFRSRTRGHEALKEQIRSAVRDGFDRFKTVAEGVRVGETSFEGVLYGFAFMRLKGQKIVLAQVWLAEDGALDAAKLAETVKSIQGRAR